MVAEKKVAFITGVAVRDSIGVLAGQGCVVPTRLIVHAGIYHEMVTLVTAAAAAYKVGDPFELGISGYGKEGGRAGIDEFLRYKTVSIIEPQ